ncbi:MAG: hypothetical protein RQ826_17815 [Xanthomonadales bacterium]|nr:hypothetical protein [Xanthomonadales bacterium]
MKLLLSFMLMLPLAVLAEDAAKDAGSPAAAHSCDDGSVRQLWEVSRDDGSNWSVLFDGHYLKADSRE